MQINPASIMQSVTDSIGQGQVKAVREEESRPVGPRSGQARPDRSQTKRPQEGRTFDEQDVIQAIEHANQSLEGIYTHFEFSIHEKTKEIMVKIIDRESGEVIREIPPEQILDMVAKMWELAGILVDERI